MRGCDGNGDGNGDGYDHDDDDDANIDDDDGDDDDDDDDGGDGDGGGVGDSDCGATDNNQLKLEADTSILTRPICSAAKTTRKLPRPANRARRRIVRRDKRAGQTSSVTVRGRRRRERREEG
jgi:hypothetical protein